MVLAKLLPRFALATFGAALPLLLLFFGSPLCGLAPLSEAERNLVLNEQHFGYESLGPLCRLGRHRPRAPEEIAVFGASSVEGAFATPGKDFSSVLHERLAKASPGKWAVHNLGRSAKTSFWVKECMRVAEQDHAKTWVVYEGHNDFADLVRAGPTKALFFLRHPKVATLAGSLLASGAGGWLRPFVKVSAAPLEWSSFDADVRAALAASEENYREMIALARAAGARLVLATVVSNLDQAPDARPVLGAPGGLDGPAAFRGAEEAFAAGYHEEALRLYKLARDRDPRMWRAPSSFNEMLRRLAKERPGEVQLLDLEAAFEREFAERKKLGCEFFGSASYCDHVHPNDFTHAWISRQLEAFLTKGGA